MLGLGILINLVIIAYTLPDPTEAYNVIRWSHGFASVTVTILGLLLLLVNAACLVQHMVSTLPLTLNSVWQQFGISLDFPSMWPLRINVAKLTLLHDHKTGGAPDESRQHSAHANYVLGLEGSQLYWYVARHTPLLMLQHDWWLIYYLLSGLNTVLGLVYHPFFFVPSLLDVRTHLPNQTLGVARRSTTAMPPQVARLPLCDAPPLSGRLWSSHGCCRR